MEPTETQTPYIGVRPGYCGGKPHILGHRIKVKHVAVWHEQMGMTPTEIVATYPTITLAQVHAALAYYHDHRDEIQAEIEEERQFVEQQRAGAPSIFDKVHPAESRAAGGAPSLPLQQYQIAMVRNGRQCSARAAH